MKLPQPLQELIDQFQALPGIGKKTAGKMAFYLLNVPQDQLLRFSGALRDLKSKTKKCQTCFNLTEEEECQICGDLRRDKRKICVVEEVLDLLVVEQTHKFDGVYHVLYGRIDPLNNLGPDDIYIPQLLKRIKNSEEGIEEVILATNPNMEGETTAMYLRNKLKELMTEKGIAFKVTRLAYGLPMGASIEYADYGTLGTAFENRSSF
jgi:recombination protein RecR